MAALIAWLLSTQRPKTRSHEKDISFLKEKIMHLHHVFFFFYISTEIKELVITPEKFLDLYLACG
jgi:hypothetical protein